MLRPPIERFDIPRSRGRPWSVIKRISFAVANELNRCRYRWFYDTRSHPGIEGRARDANEPTDANDREVTLSGEIAKLALGDGAITGEGLEVEKLGPLGAGVNLRRVRRTQSPWR